MTKTIVDELPDFYKEVLQNKKHEAPTSIYYSELKRNEELRIHTREKSRLYPLFKEDMFGFLTSKGELNLPISLDNLFTLVEDIEKEIDLAVFIRDIFETSIDSEPIKVGDKGGVEINLSPRYKLEASKLSEDIKDMRDAVKDIQEAITDTYYNAHRVYGLGSSVSLTTAHAYQIYLNRETREMIKAVNTLMGKVIRRKMELQNQQYISMAVKHKQVDQFVKSINWPVVFSKK